MNIDTLNAYSGNELVSFSYLAQGRYNIHQTVHLYTSALGTRFLLAVPQIMVCRVCNDSTLGPRQSGLACLLGCTCLVPVLSLPRLVHPSNLTFDLRLDKNTRRI